MEESSVGEGEEENSLKDQNGGFSTTSTTTIWRGSRRLSTSIKTTWAGGALRKVDVKWNRGWFVGGRAASPVFSGGGGDLSVQLFVTGWRCPALSTLSASTMAVWQRDLPQEWEVRPAPVQSGR